MVNVCNSDFLKTHRKFKKYLHWKKQLVKKKNCGNDSL